MRKENHQYFIKKEIPTNDILKKRRDAKKHLEKIISTLSAYALENFNKNWSEEEASNAIIDYLSGFSIDCLRTYAQGSLLPEIESTDQRKVFVVNSFARHLNDYFPELFDKFIIFVKGNMLANALICSDLKAINKKFQGVTFLLDTPIVLSLLGLHGTAKKQASSELIDLLKKLKARIAIFRHTSKEIGNVLDVSKDSLFKTQSLDNEIIRNAKRDKRSPSDIALIIEKLPEKYKKIGLTIIDAPGYEKKYQIDEKELEKELKKNINYRNDKAAFIDINSIRSIYAFRKGLEAKKIEDTNAVFVTSNVALAKTSYKFDKKVKSRQAVTSTITDFDLTNLAWLKIPMENPEIPRLEVIAACYSAMDPPQPLWNKYSVEIDKLKERGEITEDDHAILRTIEASDELMNVTQGSDEDLTESSIEEILKRVKKDLIRENEQEVEKEKQKHSQTKKEKEELQIKNDKYNAKLIHLSDKSAIFLSWLPVILLALVIIIFLLSSLDVVSKFIGSSIFIVLGAIIFFVNAWNGTTIKDFRDSIREWIKERILAILIRFFEKENN